MIKRVALPCFLIVLFFGSLRSAVIPMLQSNRLGFKGNSTLNNQVGKTLSISKDLETRKVFYTCVMKYIMYKEVFQIYEKLGKRRKATKCTKLMNKYLNRLVKKYKDVKSKGKQNILSDVIKSASENILSINSLVESEK